ncbi:MAG: hypothetical protein JNM93_04380 [Bacteriovoracaceae bacterium]|nr:hypothetical protein [Bacteriovoracaceae bacterium]
MNSIFLLILSFYAYADLEIDQKLHEEMQFLEQEEELNEISLTGPAAVLKPTQPQEEILDLEKQYLSDEVGSTLAAPKRRRQAEETPESSIMDGPSL